MNQYEAMFLFDPTFGTSFENCETEVRRILGRADAELVFCKKWDERRLAYRIEGRKRGVYVLVYFKADPGRIPEIERDVQISECLLRVLVLKAEGVTTEMMERAVGARGDEIISVAAEKSGGVSAKGGPDSSAAQKPQAGADVATGTATATATAPAATETTTTETAVEKKPEDQPDSKPPASGDE
ncbi:MAG: 30S ribosomal protein S6 [Planctomycetes bacterium]|nr:30S ribosomal protein S6 [Planctomycetota bacterium]